MSEKNLYENEDLTWKIHMRMLTRKMRNMEIAQIIDDTLFKYYFDKGMSVPQWKTKKNPQWWIDYLKELGIKQ